MPTACPIELALAGVVIPGQALAITTLVREGASEYAVVAADDAIAPEQTAGKELQSYLQQVAGAREAGTPQKRRSPRCVRRDHVLSTRDTRSCHDEP